MNQFASIFFLLLLLSSGLANGLTIDFDSATGSPDGYEEQGVLFSYLGTGTVEFKPVFSASNIILSMAGGDFDGATRADISDGASQVSLDLGDFGADSDRIFLSAYDAGDNLVAEASSDLDGSFVGFHTLSVNAQLISYVIFGTTGELGMGGIFANDFTWTPGAAIPEPGTALLVGCGLWMLSSSCLRRRDSIRRTA